MTPLTDIRQIPQSVLMAKTGQELMRLMEQVSVEIERLMQAQQWLHQAVTEKYAFHTSQLRQEQQQEYGDLQFECNGVEVTQSVPRRVTWDQKKLRAIAQCIREQGEDPEEFMDLTYSIPEERFDYWAARHTAGI